MALHVPASFDDPLGAAPPPEASRWPLARDGLAVLALALAALCGVVLFLPAEGRVARPLHVALGALLGRAAFLLPTGLFVAGTILLVRGVRPAARLPGWRLLGLGLLAMGVIGAEDAIQPGGAGLVGAWLRGVLLDWLGAPASLVALGLLVGVGGLLTFEARPTDVARGVGRAWGWLRHRRDARPSAAFSGNANGQVQANGQPRPALGPGAVAEGEQRPAGQAGRVPVAVSPWVFAVPRWRGLGAPGSVARTGQRAERPGPAESLRPPRPEQAVSQAAERPTRAAPVDTPAGAGQPRQGAGEDASGAAS